MAPQDDLEARIAQGVALGRQLRWTEALAVLGEAAKTAPGHARAQLGHGWALESTGELSGARVCYERALALDPRFVEAMVRLSNLAFRRADWEEAKALAARARALRPDDYLALLALASVAVATGDRAAAEDLVSELIAAKAPSPRDAALAQTLLGDLRHAQGRYAEAFAAYATSNRQTFVLYAGQYDKPGQTMADYCRWQAGYFRDAASAHWAASAQTGPEDPRDGAAGHVFLIGFPRSGTTLLESVLAAHPGVATLEERDLLQDAMRTFLSNPEARERLATLGDAELGHWRERYWTGVRAQGVQVAGKVFVDKYPLSLMKLPLVAKLFPRARILFAYRDPRDVVLSCFRRSFAMNSSMFELLDLERAAGFYDAATTLTQICREKLGLAWHDVRHEDLVDDFEQQTRALCAFLDLPRSDEMSRFAAHAKMRPVRTPSAVQVVEGLNRRGIAQWQHYAAELAPAMRLLRPWVQRWGYSE